MKAFISHETALAYWRLHFPLDAELGRPARISAAEEHASRKKDVLACVPEHLILPGKPIDVLVTSAEDRRQSQAVSCHLLREGIPSNAFYRDQDVCVSSPEFTFLQMAGSLSIAQLAALGCELCGTYVLLSRGVHHPVVLDDCPRRSMPLSTVDKLQSFVEQAKGAKGRAKALRALRFVVENARSPMETMTCLLLCLSPMLGGYGLPKPQLNPIIDLEREAQAIAHRSWCEGDICWTDPKLDLEYHGEVHVGEATMKDDVGRTLGIESMGWRVITLTSQQVLNIDEFEVVAKAVAKHLKHRLYTRVLDASSQRQSLRQELDDWMFR